MPPPSSALDLSFLPGPTSRSLPSAAHSIPASAHHSPSPSRPARPRPYPRRSPSSRPNGGPSSTPSSSSWPALSLPHRVLTLRHNPPAVPPALAQMINQIAEREGIQLPAPVPTTSPSTPLGSSSRNYASVAAAAEAASEWNSLLIQARAERGPQWDILSQRYLVDTSSDLYFDPTPLNPPPPEPLPNTEGNNTDASPPSGGGTVEAGDRPPLVNGILHEGGNSASPALGTIGIGGGGGAGSGTFSPSVDGRDGSRFETPTRRSLRSSAPNGV